jgi:hypothetical protein
MIWSLNSWFSYSKIQFLSVRSTPILLSRFSLNREGIILLIIPNPFSVRIALPWGIELTFASIFPKKLKGASHSFCLKNSVRILRLRPWEKRIEGHRYKEQDYSFIYVHYAISWFNTPFILIYESLKFQLIFNYEIDIFFDSL